MNRWSIVLLATAGFTLAGCGSIPVGDATVDVEAAQARAAQIDFKSMTRDQVHALMGVPWLANDAFGVEVYRLQGKQRNLMIILGVPIPDFSTSLAACTLVTYGSDGLVSAVASDFGVGQALSPPSLILRAGGVEFVLGGFANDTLSVPLERYLEVRSSASAGATCTVLVGGDRARVPVGSGEGCCMSSPELSIDGAGQRVLRLMVPVGIPAARDMSKADCQDLGGNFGYSGSSGEQDGGPCMFTTPRARYPLTLPAGTHLLHFTNGSAGDVISTLTCQADQVTFATLGGKFIGCLGNAGPAGDHPGPATVSLSPQAPASDGEPRVIIYDGGAWL